MARSTWKVFNCRGLRVEVETLHVVMEKALQPCTMPKLLLVPGFRVLGWCGICLTNGRYV